MKKPELEILQSLIVLTLSLLIIFGGIEFLLDIYLKTKYPLCFDSDLCSPYAEQQIHSIYKTMKDINNDGGFLWIIASSLGVMGMISPFKHLKKIQKEKSLFAFTSCPICSYEPISWDAKICPKCGTSEVNQRLFGYNFVFLSHLFYFIVCMTKAF